MNPFIESLRAGRRPVPLGIFLMSASPIVAEAIGCNGMEWAIVDAEHSPIGIAEVAHMLQAIGTTPMQAVVRVPWNDPVTVKRVLDAGAPTLLFPFVQNAEEARQAVAATRYPPAGIRGMAGLSRASRFGAVPDHFQTANERVGVILQIETPQAAAEIEAIAAVPGVDALFIGPTDLSGAMGHVGNAAHPEVRALLLDCARRCNALGKPVGTLAATAQAAAELAGAGFAFIVLSSDLGLLLGSVRAATVEWQRSQAAAEGPSTSPTELRY